MAKELPYFRFTCQEWDTGDISLENHSNKGLFIDICSYYWSQNCGLTLAKLRLKVGKMLAKSQRKANDRLLLLAESGVLKIEEGIVRISFLDKQLAEIQNKRDILSNAGKKGVEIREAKKQATLKPPLSNKDKDKDKDRDHIAGNKNSQRPRNLFWDEIVKVWNWDPQTKSEKSRVGKLAADLKKKTENPANLLKYKREYEFIYPNVACTPEAILKHWDDLKPKEKLVNKPPVIPELKLEDKMTPEDIAKMKEKLKKLGIR